MFGREGLRKRWNTDGQEGGDGIGGVRNGEEGAGERRGWDGEGEMGRGIGIGDTGGFDNIDYDVPYLSSLPD